MKKEFCVIGIGRFGRLLIENLSKLGAKVVAIDKNEEKVLSVQEFVFESYVMDTTNEKALKTLDVKDFDAILVTITGSIEASILTCVILKEMGAKKIIPRAKNELHLRVLRELGFTNAIYPEKEMAEKIAKHLVSPGLLEIIEVSDKYVLEERASLPIFSNKKLSELEFRSKFGVNVIAIKRKIPEVNERGQTVIRDEIIVGPGGDEEIKDGDILFVLGEKEKVKNLFSK
ncbi:MAG: TrkA family potassium uptake protein [Candidatus Hydrothermales bacterium]